MGPRLPTYQRGAGHDRRIFFMMVDAGDNKSQRILVDVDGDGSFSGSDDIHSPILTTSCTLDDEGNKSDPEYAVTYTLEMGPSNGLLPVQSHS